MISPVELLEKYKVEINSHEWSRVEPLLSKECTFWFSTGTYKGLEQTRNAFEKTWSIIENEVYSIQNVEWLCSNKESATCIYGFHWAGLIKGKPSEGKGRGTSVFKVEDGAWKLVHEHLSATS